MGSSKSESAWFSFESNRGVEIHYLFDYIKKSQATCDDAGYELTIALKDKEFAEKNGIDQAYIVKSFATYISRDLIDPFPSRIVTAVPSSKLSNYRRAIDEVVEMVNGWHDEQSRPYLKRTTEIESAHLGGSRDRSTHERTIDAPYKGWIRGRHFLIIDDVATSCNSMEVCRQKLLDAGAASVECAVFSKTFDDYRDSKTSNAFKVRRSRAKSFLTLAKSDRRARKNTKSSSRDFSNPIKSQPTRQTFVEPDSVRGELLEIRKVSSDHRAFFSSGESIAVPIDWQEYLNGMLYSEIELGRTDVTRGSQTSRVFYAKTNLTESLNTGDFIRHIEYGVGRVLKVNENSLTLLFAQDLSERQLWIPCHQIYPASAVDFYLARYDAGDVKGSAGMLAKLFNDIDKEKSKKYFKDAIEAGDLSTVLSAAKFFDGEGDSRADVAAKYYEHAFSLGEREDSPFWLGRYYANKHEPDYEKAEKYYRVAIDCGDNFASPNNLAILLEDTDREEAIRLYRIAIEAGNLAKAPCNLAILIQNVDRDEAVCLYELSIKNGNTDYAAWNCADLLVESNKERAMELYQLSSDSGNKTSSFKLAQLLETIDKERALVFYQLASDIADANKRRESLFKLGYLNEPNRSLAVMYYKKAIEAGETYASPNNLGSLISREDLSKAQEYWKMASDSGNHFYAARKLGLALLEDGKSEGLKYLKLSADSGNSDACNDYARYVQETDRDEAIKYYERGMGLGENKYCPYNYGCLVLPDDHAKAVDLLSIAASSGNVSAMNRLALLLEDSDPQKAIALFEHAIKLGDLTASTNNLALFIQDNNKQRAKQLYETAIENGEMFHAAKNYGELIRLDDPREAVELLWMSYEAGNSSALLTLGELRRHIPFSIISKIPFSASDIDDPIVLMNLGVFWLGQKTEKALENAANLFERAIELGDKQYSTCNLAMMLSSTDANRAIALYEEALKYDETEAKLGLSWLLEELDPERAKRLSEQAYASDDIVDVLLFVADYYNGLDDSKAHSLYEEAAERGSAKAAKKLGQLEAT